jgi:hypothetical protein
MTKTLNPNKPKIEKIPVSSLVPAPWNYKLTGTKEQIEKLKKSILSSQSAGVLCVRNLKNRNGKKLFEVIDGNHRLEAVIEAGWKTVWCENFGKLSQAQAVVIARQRNWQWFADDVVKLGKLYTDEVLKMFEKDDVLEFLPEDLPELDRIIEAGIEGVEVEPEPDPEPGQKPGVIKLTAEQYLQVMEAVNTLRQAEGDESISEGRALELICADYLAGADTQEQET